MRGRVFRLKRMRRPRVSLMSNVRKEENLQQWLTFWLYDCFGLQVRSQIPVVDMVAENLKTSVTSLQKDSREIQWETFMEEAGVLGEANFVKNGFVDHINTTKDSTDYLWYTIRCRNLASNQLKGQINDMFGKLQKLSVLFQSHPAMFMPSMKPGWGKQLIRDATCPNDHTRRW